MTDAPTYEELLKSYARRFGPDIPSEMIVKQFDKYWQLGCLDVKRDANQREWNVTLKSPGPKN